ncbi:hypothetical protein HK101_005213, partial [Irineochytrium annulatum]
MHTTDIHDPQASKMNSITQENDLEAFLSYASLAGTEFTAEKLNVQVIPKQQHNPFLLTPAQEADLLASHAANASSLTVPRRPVWDGTATPEEQQRRERESFLQWRRSLVVLEEEKELLMTPYERNIEVWRQLWRVCERSDVVIQIVDARAPLTFRCKDLEAYVKELDGRKVNHLLINKADMLTDAQRAAWAEHLEKEGVGYSFFSAALARKRMEEERERARAEEEEVEMREREREVREEIRRLKVAAK